MREIFTPIREDVRSASECFIPTDFTPLHTDIHTAASLLQKAIRRSDEALALSAAQNLLRDDPRRFWRRFSTCLFEDVGLADRSLILSALSLAPTKVHQKAAWSEVAFVVSLVCRASKTQTANHALHLAMHDRSEVDAMPPLECQGFNQVYGMIERDHLTPVQKSLIAWRLSGVACGRGFEPEAHPDADLGKLFAHLDRWLESVELSLIMREGVRLVGGPLPIAAVVMERMSSISNQTDIASDNIPECGEVLGLPGYVFDQHTRLGKRALRIAAHDCPNLRETLASIVGGHARLRCLSSAHFEYEAALLTKRIQSEEQLCALQKVRMTGAYRRPGFSEKLYSALREDWPIFLRIREQLTQ